MAGPRWLPCHLAAPPAKAIRMNPAPNHTARRDHHAAWRNDDGAWRDHHGAMHNASGTVHAARADDGVCFQRAERDETTHEQRQYGQMFQGALPFNRWFLSRL